MGYYPSVFDGYLLSKPAVRRKNIIIHHLNMTHVSLGVHQHISVLLFRNLHRNSCFSNHPNTTHMQACVPELRKFLSAVSFGNQTPWHVTRPNDSFLHLSEHLLLLSSTCIRSSDLMCLDAQGS